MLMLLITVVLGVFFAIFATQNTGSITLNFGDYILPNVPTYLAVLIPLLIGLLLGFFIYTFKSLSQNMTISEDKDRIKNLKKDLAEVAQRAHKLELENTKLKVESGRKNDENSI